MILDCGGVTISNGQVTFIASTEYNAVATLTCNDGYNLTGTDEIICSDTGTWDISSTGCSIKGKRSIKSYGSQSI